MLKKPIALFSLFLILMACSSTEKTAPTPYVPPTNFDDSSYINPEDYGYSQNFNTIERKENEDPSFSPTSLDQKQLYENLTYPREARDKRIEGRVTVKTYIDSTGTLTNMKIFYSPHKLLTEATKRALIKTIFSPATLNGKAVNSFRIYNGDFKLQR